MQWNRRYRKARNALELITHPIRFTNSYRFADDIEMMTGSRPGLYWMICWKYLSPIAMITILTASLLELASSGSSYPAWVAEKGLTELREWPHWCIVLAVFLILVSVMWIPVVAITRLDLRNQEITLNYN